jgi:SAM-dependent methyltransferase
MPATPVLERGPIVTDDSIAIIRPIPILAIGDPTPVAPLPPPVAAPPAAPAAPATPQAAPETTMPSTPSPFAGGQAPVSARSVDVAATPGPVSARPAESPQAPPAARPIDAPATGVETTLPSQPSPLRSPAQQAASPAAAAPHEEVEAIEEIEPERDSGPPSDKERAVAKKADKHDEDSLEEIEPADEIDAERISLEDRAVTEEIPVVMMEVEPDEQPRRPPPPPKRTDAQAPATPPPAPAAAPASKPAPPAAKPASPAAKPETRKRPWWEEIFSEDFIRTMDQPKPSYVAREVNFIEESLGVEKGAVVLDLACGTGSHAVELASRGYSVVGFDLSLAMLARASDEAQERGQKLNFLQGDMREMAFEEMFDGIYCWSTSFGYFDEEKNIDVLARAHRALRHGGMLLIDIINRDFVAPRQPSLVWFEGDGCVCMDEMHVDFFTSRLKVKRTVMFEDGRTREVDYSIRIYNLHEIGKMMHDCGFRVVQVTGHPAHPGVFFGSESPRIIVLAERAD